MRTCMPVTWAVVDLRRLRWLGWAWSGGATRAWCEGFPTASAGGGARLARRPVLAGKQRGPWRQELLASDSPSMAGATGGGGARPRGWARSGQLRDWATKRVGRGYGGAAARLLHAAWDSGVGLLLTDLVRQGMGIPMVSVARIWGMGRI
ncbi:hypothetical protein ZWY2020_037560 [Hordeum vulgare]|nr:hypothetical protein ZWY2020_037560 [Hordeum vulgare]